MAEMQFLSIFRSQRIKRKIITTRTDLWVTTRICTLTKDQPNRYLELNCSQKYTGHM